MLVLFSLVSVVALIATFSVRFVHGHIRGTLFDHVVNAITGRLAGRRARRDASTPAFDPFAPPADQAFVVEMGRSDWEWRPASMLAAFDNEQSALDYLSELEAGVKASDAWVIDDSRNNSFEFFQKSAPDARSFWYRVVPA